MAVKRDAVARDLIAFERAKLEYEAHTKLLALDIEEARVGLQAAEQRMKVNPDANEVELEVVKAKLRIELAQTLLNLHTSGISEESSRDAQPAQGVIPDESKPSVTQEVGDRDPTSVAAKNANAAQLTELGARRIAKGTRGTWSPDGKRIALGKMPFGSGIAVVEVTGVASDSPSPTSGTRPTFVLDAEIGSVRDLVADGKDPAWSPDGKRVAFTREVARRSAERRDLARCG